jgi:hypothetical protein
MIVFDAVRLIGLTEIDLPIFGVKATDPYQVAHIDGLGPPELDVVLAETHTPGGVFVDRRSQGRQIVARVGLNPDYKIGQTVSDLRYYLYGLLSPGVDPANQSIRVVFLSQNEAVVETVGYVKRIEIVPFNKKPEVQITIDCLGPYLEKPDVTRFIPPATSTWTIDNVGLAPTGVAFEIKFLTAVSTFSIAIQNGTFMDFQSAFAVNDRLIVDTNQATRQVKLKREASFIRFLEMLTAESKWLTLHGGTHVVQTSNPSQFEWISFEYRSRHWGI